MCDTTHLYVTHSYSYVWCDTHAAKEVLIHICDMTYSYVWHDSSICDSSIFICVLSNIYDSFSYTYVTHSYLMSVITHMWLIYIYDSFICDSFIYVTHSYSYVWHDAFICMIALIYMWLIDICNSERVMSHMWHIEIGNSERVMPHMSHVSHMKSHVTYLNESCHTYERVM